MNKIKKKIKEKILPKTNKYLEVLVFSLPMFAKTEKHKQATKNTNNDATMNTTKEILVSQNKIRSAKRRKKHRGEGLPLS